jgi:hypothetical protein
MNMMELHLMSAMEAEEAVAEQEHEVAPSGLDALDEQLLDQVVGQARERGVKLAGEGGLLQALTRWLLESALEGEITDHLGYEKHDGAGDGSGNSRNGRWAKTVLTDIGPVEIEVPRDRAGSFEPQIVRKRQRRLTGVDEMALSLSARGLTHGGRSPRTWPRSTGPRCRRPRSPTRSWTGWRSGRTGRSTLASASFVQGPARVRIRRTWSQRMLITGVFNLLSGVAAALLAGPFTGALPGSPWPVALTLTLPSAAGTLATQALASLLGAAGYPTATVLFVAVGIPASGGVVGADLLPTPARSISALLPPGAAVRAIRGFCYFDGSHVVVPLFTLTGWAAAGAALLWIRGRRAEAGPSI